MFRVQVQGLQVDLLDYHGRRAHPHPAPLPRPRYVAESFFSEWVQKAA